MYFSNSKQRSQCACCRIEPAHTSTSLCHPDVIIRSPQDLPHMAQTGCDHTVFEFDSTGRFIILIILFAEKGSHQWQHQYSSPGEFFHTHRSKLYGVKG